MITVLHSPGQSPGSVCFSGDGLLFSGDVLLCGGVGRVDVQHSSREDQIRYCWPLNRDVGRQNKENNVNRVIHFEIHAEDSQRAITFYSGLFGWKFTRWNDQVEYWAIETGPKTEPGIDGGLLPRRGTIDGRAVTAYICTVEIKDLDQIIRRAEATGATVSVPKMAIPGIGWLAYLKDTEGNSFGVMQSDPNAR